VGPGESGAGARSVEVPLRRLSAWLDGFARRHGDSTSQESGPGWRLTAQDGATALVHRPAWVAHVAAPASPAELATLQPRFGVVLIRRAGYAIALVRGRDILDRKVGSRHIHGRTAAGGWSQQRYARRRANQADEIVEAAAGAADRIIGGAISGPGPAPQLLVTGGDRPLVAAVLDHVEPRVAGLPLAAHVGVGTPDAAVLATVVDRALAVQVDITDP
jgi:hypothetical protein